MLQLLLILCYPVTLTCSDEEAILVVQMLEFSGVIPIQQSIKLCRTKDADLFLSLIRGITKRR
jgi:hypothetical protein